jgi:hypothetical protein
MRDVATLTAAEFAGALGSAFEVLDPDGRVMLSLTLVQVVPGPERPGQRQPFSLYWTGLAAPILPSFTHHLTHPGLGDMEIFLGPVATDGPGLTYEAVFD